MKTAVVYFSKHHGNTRKLLDAIAQKHELTLIDVTEKQDIKLEEFDRIGFASGIYYGSFAKQLLKFASEHLPVGKKIFLISSYGAAGKHSEDSIRRIVSEKNCEVIGSYGCVGFDTFGPFKLIGGLHKGHPTEEDIAGAVKFYDDLG